MAPGGRCVWTAGVPASSTLEVPPGGPSLFPRRAAFPSPDLPLPVSSSCPLRSLLPIRLAHQALARNLDNDAHPGHPVPDPPPRNVRPPCHDGFMGKAAVAKAFEDIKAALAVLNAEVDECGSEPFSAADPLAGLADGCLDILAGARVAEAGFAGLKARAAVTYADTAQAIAPDAPVQAQEMAVAAEIGCLLALGTRAAGAFLAASHTLCQGIAADVVGIAGRDDHLAARPGHGG
jgi:hypothetical protein